MPPILSLLKYGFTTRRSPALNIFSILVALWASGWLILWTLGFVYSEPDGEGGPSYFLAATCAWFIMVIMFCVLPVVVQLAWARKVQNEEVAGGPLPWPYYPPVQPYQWQPAPPVYPPPAPRADISEVERRLAEEREKRRELEYENVLLRQRVREDEEKPAPKATVERLVEAQGLEQEMRYADAALIYEEMGRWDDAGRVRILDIRGGKP